MTFLPIAATIVRDRMEARPRPRKPEPKGGVTSSSGIARTTQPAPLRSRVVTGLRTG
jgi:hypothetical protein